MLTESQKKEIAALVCANLDAAEDVWEEVGEDLMVKSFTEALALDKRADVVPSKIPGHPLVNDAKPLVDTFIALVADIRNSSGHLLQAISEKQAKVSQLQRVYYETSALLPALAKTIGYERGRVTEYLGDGVLGLFNVNDTSPSETIYAAHRAAKDCIRDTRPIVNQELRNRYGLPDLDFGIGMSFSKAIVTLVGLDGDKHPKVIGECVYRASKLSKGINEIYVDKWLYEAWPTAKEGTLRFRHRKFGGEDGYQVGG